MGAIEQPLRLAVPWKEMSLQADHDNKRKMCRQIRFSDGPLDGRVLPQPTRIIPVLMLQDRHHHRPTRQERHDMLEIVLGGKCFINPEHPLYQAP